MGRTGVVGTDAVLFRVTIGRFYFAMLALIAVTPNSEKQRFGEGVEEENPAGL